MAQLLRALHHLQVARQEQAGQRPRVAVLLAVSQRAAQTSEVAPRSSAVRQQRAALQVVPEARLLVAIDQPAAPLRSGERIQWVGRDQRVAHLLRREACKLEAYRQRVAHRQQEERLQPAEAR